MAIVVTPPDFRETLKSSEQVRKLFELGAKPEFQQMIQTANERYTHWHRFRYVPIPEGLTHEELWALLKIGRRANFKQAPFTDKRGMPFWYWIPDALQKYLHDIDVWA